MAKLSTETDSTTSSVSNAKVKLFNWTRSESSASSLGSFMRSPGDHLNQSSRESGPDGEMNNNPLNQSNRSSINNEPSPAVDLDNRATTSCHRMQNENPNQVCLKQ